MRKPSWTKKPCKYVPGGPHKTRPKIRPGGRKGRLQSRARYLWEQEHGPIPPGMYVCHHCDDGHCIEITHLFLGTHADNMADMAKKSRGRGGNSDKTHCANGHEFTPENTYQTINYNGRPRRACKKCRAAAVQRAKRKKGNNVPRTDSKDLQE